MNSYSSAYNERENLPQEFADITLTVFWRARPNKALLRIAFEKYHSSTIELVNLPLYWPR